MCMIQDLPSFVMYCGLHANILVESESTLNLDARNSASSLEMLLVLTLTLTLVLALVLRFLGFEFDWMEKNEESCDCCFDLLLIRYN